MKKIVSIALAAMLAAACNNSSKNTSTTDSSATKDNTNVYDTGVGSSMTDTSNRNMKRDTSLMPNKMQDTGMKK
ncbi:MAG TPA: hypothetical protein VFP87_15820 [Chitinophagaceae bacterium]|nr:hypothetical protein [Chitinophagaceae bacterium]